jgi:hypothetical protein
LNLLESGSVGENGSSFDNGIQYYWRSVFRYNGYYGSIPKIAPYNLFWHKKLVYNFYRSKDRQRRCLLKIGWSKIEATAWYPESVVQHAETAIFLKKVQLIEDRPIGNWRNGGRNMRKS